MMGSLTDVIEGKSIGKTQMFMASSGLFMMVLTIGIGTFVGRRAIAKLEKEQADSKDASSVGDDDEETSDIDSDVDIESGVPNTVAELRFEDVEHEKRDVQRLFPESVAEIPEFETMTSLIVQGLPSPILSRIGLGRKHQSAPATTIVI
jgi:hypothetical protein